MRQNSFHMLEQEVLHSRALLITLFCIYQRIRRTPYRREGGVLTDMDRAHLTVSDVAEIYLATSFMVQRKCGERYRETREGKLQLKIHLWRGSRQIDIPFRWYFTQFILRTGEPYLFTKTTTTNNTSSLHRQCGSFRNEGV